VDRRAFLLHKFIEKSQEHRRISYYPYEVIIENGKNDSDINIKSKGENNYGTRKEIS